MVLIKNFTKYVIILFLLALLGNFMSCKSDKSSGKITLQEIGPIIQSYTAQNEKFPHLTVVGSEEEFPKPSYQLYLYIWNSDTVVSIVQRPFFIDYEGPELSDSTILNPRTKPAGFYMYKNEFPIIIFDPDSLLNENSLNRIATEIPNSFKYSGENIHRKLIIWDYNLKNGKFVRDDRKIPLYSRRKK